MGVEEPPTKEGTHAGEVHASLGDTRIRHAFSPSRDTCIGRASVLFTDTCLRRDSDAHIRRTSELVLRSAFERFLRYDNLLSWILRGMVLTRRTPYDWGVAIIANACHSQDASSIILCFWIRNIS